MAEVVVRKLKFDGSLKYAWPGEVRPSGRDDWVTVYHNPRTYQKRMADGSIEQGDPSHLIHYVSLAEPLTVIFAYSLDGAFLDAKCDAALPGERHGEMLDFVDLDLDVVVLPGGAHYVRDQEVFAERAVSMGYSDEAKRAAHLGVLHALRMVRGRRFPFDGHADRLVADIVSGAARRK